VRYVERRVDFLQFTPTKTKGLSEDRSDEEPLNDYPKNKDSSLSTVVRNER
jgi:hypothetical protein